VPDGTLVSGIARRWRVALHDRIRASAVVSDLIALFFLLRWRSDSTGRIELPPRALEQGLRFSRRSRVRAWVRSRYERWKAEAHLASPTPGPGRRLVSPPAGDSTLLPHSLLLKAPGPGGEKGVLFLGTEGDWSPLIQNGNVDALKRDFHITAMAASAAPPLRKLHALGAPGDDPLHLGIGNEDHYDYTAVLGNAVIPLPIMGCDWLDPAAFRPKPRTERGIDILMVASWLELKRHWLLFKALRALPPDLHVVLVGGPAEGRTLEDMQAEARAWGVRQDIVYHEHIPNEEVYRLQCDSKIALQLSRREGPCVAVVEAMMADTPVGMMTGGYVGSSRYINDQTGRFLLPKGIGAQVQDFLEASASYQPRQWVERHASYAQSHEKLQAHLQAVSNEKRLPWVQGLAPVTRKRQKLSYVDPADAIRLAPAIDELRRVYGIVFGNRP